MFCFFLVFNQLHFSDLLGTERSFEFDRVFSESDSQASVFESVWRLLVDICMKVGSTVD